LNSRRSDSGAKKEKPDDPGELGGDLQAEHRRGAVGRRQGATRISSHEPLPNRNAAHAGESPIVQPSAAARKAPAQRVRLQSAETPCKLAGRRALVAAKTRKDKEIGGSFSIPMSVLHLWASSRSAKPPVGSPELGSLPSLGGLHVVVLSVDLRGTVQTARRSAFWACVTATPR
jgi:hypothetical protein